MRILLTGATGCVGQALVPELTDAGHELIVVVRPDSPSQIANKHISTVHADLTQSDFATKLPPEVDAVLHVAQSRRFREFPDGAAEVFAINTAATFNLVEYACRAKAKSFVFTSTGSVYVPQHEPVAETAPTAPASFYPASKLAAESLLAPYSGSLSLSILRLFYVFGPGQTKMLVDGLADRIRRGVPISLAGETGIKLAPTYSGDVARIVRKSVEDGWSGTYNVGSPAIVSLKTLGEGIARAIGKQAEFEQAGGLAPPTPLPKLDKLGSVFDLSGFTALDSALAETFGATAKRVSG